MRENADQNNSGYEHFSSSDSKKWRELWSAPFLFYLENKYIIRKVPFFRSFFDDSGDMLYLEQTQACQIFHIACFNFVAWNP